MIDLSRWNYTSPVGAKITPTQELAKRKSTAFLIFRDNGDITCRAPSSGEGIQATKNSTYPRSEFRETNLDGSNAAWLPPDAPIHVLEGEFTVEEEAADKKAILGQIHGKSKHPPLKVARDGTKVSVQLRREYTPDDEDDGKEDKPQIGTAAIGQKSSYRVEVYSDWRVKIFFNGVQVIKGVLAVGGYQFDAESYAKDAWYFKAGMYSQTKVGGKGCGQVTFHALHLYHGAPVTVPEPSPEPAPSTPPAEPEEAPEDAPLSAASITKRLDAAEKLTGKARGAEINVITNLIDDSGLSDKEQAPLYARAKKIKAGK